MDAETVFGHAVALIFRDWGRVGTFLRVSEIGIHHAKGEFTQEAEESLSTPTGYDPSFIEFLKGFGTAEYAGLQIGDAQSAVDAAALVFMHSVVDHTAMTCCGLIAIVKPEEWEPWIGEKQISLSEMKNSGYNSLFRKALNRRLAKLRYESLLAKADLILRLCRPPDKWKPNVENYVYDRTRLSVIDGERHEVVHGNSWTGGFRRDRSDLRFLFETGLYFLDLFSFTFRAQDPRNQRSVS